jgi:hypothetical protein
MASERSREPEVLREQVREGYTRIVQDRPDAARADEAARRVGYSDEQLEAVPEGANLGVGCGNPTAIDTLEPGETVVDLGSGAGMGAFPSSSTQRIPSRRHARADTTVRRYSHRVKQEQENMSFPRLVENTR